MDELKGTNPAEQPDPMLTQPEMPEMPGDAAAEAGSGGGTGAEAKKPAALFIFLTVMLDMLALGMIAPVLPRLIEGFLGGNVSSAAKMLGIFGTTFAVMQFFFSPVLGSMSDRFGRRPIVLLSNFGLAGDYLLMAWAPALPWLFVGRIISGITASSIPTAMAYMADVTPHEKRAGAFGMLSAAFGVGFVVGPAMGGLLGSVSPRLPFFVAAGLSLMNGMYGLFVLPESLKMENRSKFSWKRANPVGSMVMLTRSRPIMLLSAVLVLGYVAQSSLMNVYVIYTDYRYHWTPRQVGLSLGFLGIFTIVYGLLVRKATPKFGERLCIFFGLTMGVLGYGWFALAGTGAWFLMGIPVLNLMSFTWPSAQGLMSKATKPNEQGQMQGAINGLRGGAGIVGPSLFTFIFALVTAPGAAVHVLGAPFFLAGALLLVAIPVAVLATRGVQRPA